MNHNQIQVQIEFKTLQKVIKISMNPRSTIKQHLPFLNAKFDTDFSSFQVTANIKDAQRRKIPIDVPLRSILGEPLPASIVIEIVLSYDGG